MAIVSGLYYRRELPHLSGNGKTYFVTFCTRMRRVIEESCRELVLARFKREHFTSCYVSCAIVMPDHVHTIITPYDDHSSLDQVLRRIKGGSAFDINRARGTSGAVWQWESFDHILRSDESLAEKIEYIRQNPVRAGLVERAEDYPYYWEPERYW